MTSSDTVWRAMAGNPLHFLFSAWPWRCVAYLVTTIVVAFAVWSVCTVGVLFPPVLVLLGLPVGVLERRRLPRSAGN